MMHLLRKGHRLAIARLVCHMLFAIFTKRWIGRVSKIISQKNAPWKPYFFGVLLSIV